ncbi:MAG: prolipoprotein diacylglyceryl transferase [Tenericutes bacterium]|nr:prolipoprotein diacylglyceryl transferase [Mycoplasmatota bacterium]
MENLITIAGFEIRWYSILILVGVVLGFLLVFSESNRFNIKREFTFNMLFWTIIFGIIGARVYYVVFNWSYYSEHLGESIKIWNGGLAIHGAILFGALTMIIYSKKYKSGVAKMFDIAVPALLLAQAIGRWGNFFNAEAYGVAVEYTTLVNMKIIPQFVIDNMYINGSYHLPMFYFESLWCFLGFIIAMIIRRKKYIKITQLTGFYLIWYGAARIVIEIFRTDSLMIGGFKVAIIVSALMVVIGILIELIQGRKPKLEELYNASSAEEIRF